MSTGLLAYLIPVLAATAVYCCVHCHPQYANNAKFRNFPCPNAEDIAPCTCEYYMDLDVMNMDCMGIADDQQLYDVFHSDIPVHKFGGLFLGTDHLTTLSDTVFGEAIFDSVITIPLTGNGTLTSVGPKTFIKSASTLIVLYLEGNQITDFPFETISQYTRLRHLSLSYNPLPSFPVVSSESLEELELGNSAYHDIPAAIMDLPKLEELNIQRNSIESLAKDAFTSLPKLQSILMSETGLTHLESRQFAVNSTMIAYINLSDNLIEAVDTDTFTGLQPGTMINLQNNKLTILEESTWKPLFDAGVMLWLQGNDLTCGCDVAWLVVEPTYDPLVEGAICHSGEMLADLDPHWFEDNC